MGGIGSGNIRQHHAKNTTERSPSIDIRRWQREALLTPGQEFTWQWYWQDKLAASIRVRPEEACLVLTYQCRIPGGKWQPQSYPIYLDWSPCHLGGKRPWFFCPSCSRRVAILYSGELFACRHCHQLVYLSQRESYDDRAARRANRIRKKLGWNLGILNDTGLKPKGMHWKTYDKLFAQHDRFVGTALMGIAQRLNFMD
jgi:hypothetical protein